MNSFLYNTTMFGITVTILGYYLGTRLKARFKLAIFNPLLISVVFVMSFLLFFKIKYDTYYSSAKVISFFLTPATVSLAIPLYEQLELLKRHMKAVVAGIVAGVLSSLGSIYLLAVLFQLSHGEYVTLLPKSITTAIGIGISEELGGITTITVAAIVLTGIWGSMIAETLCKVFRITNSISKGVAIGTASHAIGTAKAIEMGEIEGAMSSLAIVISGLSTVLGAGIFAKLY
ncbi:MAG: LrgB family protein [Lachnospiraceae bacterium]